MNNDALEAIRSQIDEVDTQLLDLVQKRMQMAASIADIKRESNLPIYDGPREQAIVARLTERADADCQMAVSMVMRTMFALARVRQRELLMPPTQLLPAARAPRTDGVVCACVGEEPVKQRFPDADYLACDSSEAVFAAVKDGRAHYGVVPIEHAHTGSVGETYDLLRRNACYVVGKTSAKRTGGETSYVVIAGEPEYDGQSNRISITFVVEHRSGALCETLMPFHALGINLQRLESRLGPQGGYRFFAEMEGNILDKEIVDSLRQASETCEYLEVLGCYRAD